MTVPESQEHLHTPVVPFQAPPPDSEIVTPEQRIVIAPVIADLEIKYHPAFAQLVEIAQVGYARLLGGYLDQRARNPAVSTRELRAQKAARRRDPEDYKIAVDIRCLRAARRADWIDLPPGFLPDDLRPRRRAPILTPAALVQLGQDPTYANLAMNARNEDRDAAHYYARWLGFYAMGWAAKQVARQRKAAR